MPTELNACCLILQQREFEQENDKLQADKQGSIEHFRYKLIYLKFEVMWFTVNCVQL